MRCYFALIMHTGDYVLTAPYLKNPLTVFDAVILVLRLVILAMLLLAFAPVVFLRAEDAQTAVNTEKIKTLESTNAALVQQNSNLEQRVSRIEGVGIGLGALTSVQLFLQLGAHFSIRRKGR